MARKRSPPKFAILAHGPSRENLLAKGFIDGVRYPCTPSERRDREVCIVIPSSGNRFFALWKSNNSNFRYVFHDGEGMRFNI